MPVIITLLIPSMKKRLPSILTTMIGAALYHPWVTADDLASQCMLGVPVYNRPLIQGSPDELPVTINSDQVKGDYPNNAVFSGNVDIRQGNGRMLADKVQLNQRQPNEKTEPVRTVDATGNVHYDDDQVILKGPKAWSNLNTKDTNMWQGEYQMVGRQGRGVADKMALRGNNRYTILENGSFTTCLPGSNSWSVVGSEVIQDREEQVAEIWNARFKIGSVPIFYSPYLQMPIGDKRRSGFLIPAGKYSNNDGFQFALPYYWNIAPQADATLTPNYISKRGVQWQNEFRYLTEVGSGLIEFDYLATDRQFRRDEAARNSDNGDANRWLFYWKHSGVWQEHWRFNTDYTKVSDSWYFNDLDSKYYSSTDGYASQKFSIGYADTNWNATLSSKDFQIFEKDRNKNVYRAQPQLDFNYYANDVGPFDTRLFAQAVKFTNVNRAYPDATRFHLEPAVNLPLSTRWGSLNTETKLLATHYQQTHLEGRPELEESVNRVLPQFKIDGKMGFDRQMTWNPAYTQTLEPRVQYLYTAYRNQENIYSYDSTLLQTDYTGLFRDRSYSGLDRIASNNQIAAGVTSRIYDQDLVERFNVSVGQIYSFNPSRTGLEDREARENRGSLIWAGDAYWKISDNWGARGGLQYDTKLDDIAQGNAVLEYRHDANRMLQLNYRYSSPEYVANARDISGRNKAIYENGISQAGITGSWPVADAWALVGGYYYDINENKPVEQLVGVQYSSCCYALRVGYERKINGWQNNDSKYDNQITFNIELRGLNSSYSLGSQEMLRAGILPYQRAF